MMRRCSQGRLFALQYIVVAVIHILLFSSESAAWETKAEALKQAVQLFHNPDVFGVSTLSTQYPADHPVTDLTGHAMTGPEYFAPCDSDEGSLLYLGLTVSQTWRNVLKSETKNATISVASNADPSIPDPRHRSPTKPSRWNDHRPSWRRGMPSKSRITLFGHFDILNVTVQPDEAQRALHCFLRHHPDASHWAPNATESPHIPFWAIFHVDKAYWVGGFGDEHYIGWFSSDEWNAAWKENSRFDQASLATQSSTQDGLWSTGDHPVLLSEASKDKVENTADQPRLKFQ